MINLQPATAAYVAIEPYMQSQGQWTGHLPA